MSKDRDDMALAAKAGDYDRVLELAKKYHTEANTPIDYGEAA